MFPNIYVKYFRLLNKKITTDSLRCLSSGGNPHYHNHRQHYVFHEENISLLTVEKPDAEGKQAWSLTDDKTIGDVTHGPCRSARYTPEGESGSCSPKYADRSAFPLKPGESPPLVSGCNRKNYAVLIFFAVPADA